MVIDLRRVKTIVNPHAAHHLKGKFRHIQLKETQIYCETSELNII